MMSYNSDDRLYAHVRDAVLRIFGATPPWKHRWTEATFARARAEFLVPYIDQQFLEKAVNLLERHFGSGSAGVSGVFDNSSTGLAQAAEAWDGNADVLYVLLVCDWYPVATLRARSGTEFFEGWNREWRLHRDVATRSFKIIAELAPPCRELLASVGYQYRPWDCEAFQQRINGRPAWDYLFYLGHPG